MMRVAPMDSGCCGKRWYAVARLGVAALICVRIGSGVSAQPAEDVKGWRESLPMMNDPVLEPPAQMLVVHERLVSLWLEAIDRPEFDLRVNAVNALVDLRVQGATGLEIVLPRLQRLVSDDAVEAVRDSAARALVAFDDRTSASLLAEAMASQRVSDQVVMQAIDPALATWGLASAEAQWRSRLERREGSLGLQASAARRLGEAGVESASALLMSVAMDAGRSVSVRFAAAEAVAKLNKQGLENNAQLLFAAGDARASMLAIAMLGGHHGEAAIRCVQASLSHDNARVREQAVRWFAREGRSAVSTVEPLAGDADAGVRLAVMEVIRATWPQSAIDVLIAALADQERVVRDAAADGLAAVIAGDEARSEVQAALSDTLAGSNALALEQASRLVGYAGMVEESPRLLALLGHESPRVRIAAAQGLRVLQIAETESAILDRCRILTSQMDDPPADAAPRQAVADELAQHFMLLGQLRCRAADPLLQRYLPKRSGFAVADRAAAIYALGLIHEGQPADAALIATLEERLGDNNPLDPEASEVRRFSAVALGRMRATTSTDLLKMINSMENSTISVGASTRWALTQITGQPQPALQRVEHIPGPYFLEPAN